jgi:hypothetical protein
LRLSVLVLRYCLSQTGPRFLWIFGGYSDEQGSLTLQTTVRGVTFRVDATLIGTIIETDPVPFEGSPFPDFVVSPTMEELLMFFDHQHRA